MAERYRLEERVNKKRKSKERERGRQAEWGNE